jgi:RNAse (barnase) inhibitor barstar
MRELILNARDWRSPDDFYDAFFAAVGAPPWHGRNFNALRDSICAGRINAIEPPYRVRIKNYSLIGASAREVASDFVELLNELRRDGVEVDVAVET